MTRAELHARLDRQLDELGFKNDIVIKWGSLTLEVKYEAGREVLTIRERETSKP